MQTIFSPVILFACLATVLNEFWKAAILCYMWLLKPCSVSFLCAKTLQLYLTLCDIMDCSQPGCSVHGPKLYHSLFSEQLHSFTACLASLDPLLIEPPGFLH